MRFCEHDCVILAAYWAKVLSVWGVMPTLEDKIGQMFLVGFEGLEAPAHILEWLAQGRIGGVILFARNVQSPEQLARLTQQCHQAAKAPILIGIDQEGGEVARLRTGFTESPGAMALSAAHNGVELAERMSAVLATELRALGINWNYAPVLDISYSIENPAVGTRSPGSDAQRVSAIAAAEVRGFQSAGIAACGKHFPGLGATPIDTHVDLPRLNTPVEQLLAHDLLPYRAAIQAGVASIMTTHTIYTELDTHFPATLSPIIVQKLLREELQFEGVVTTDCMEMHAISQHFGTPQAAVHAAAAGIDLILVSHTRSTQAEAYDKLLEAVKNGIIPLARVEDANERIQKLKAQVAITAAPDVSNIRKPEHVAVADEAARAGTILVKTNPQLFPLKPDTHYKVGVIEFASYLESGILEVGGLTGFAQYIKKRLPTAATLALKASHPTPLSLEQANKIAAEAHLLILATRNAHLIPEELEIARELMTIAQHTILVCLRNPYDASVLAEADVILCTCGGSAPSIQAAVDALFGDFTPTGVLPVTFA